jgi:hypothetical protein
VTDNSLGRLIDMLDDPVSYQEAVEDIIELLASNEDTTREEAAKTLLQLGERLFVPLVDALYHPNSTVQGAAADLLGELQDERARDALKVISQTDDSHWVRSRAKLALDRLPVDEDEKEASRSAQHSAHSETLELIRSQQADWSSLLGKPETQDTSPLVTKDMEIQQIRAMLDKLDVRLANGEISEETYKRLTERWQIKLKNMEN